RSVMKRSLTQPTIDSGRPIAPRASGAGAFSRSTGTPLVTLTPNAFTGRPSSGRRFGRGVGRVVCSLVRPAPMDGRRGGQLTRDPRLRRAGTGVRISWQMVAVRGKFVGWLVLHQMFDHH